MLMDTNGHTILSEDYCSYEVAKLLKEKGFDGECSKFYMPTGNGRWKYAHYHDFDISDRIDCPTLQMAMKWLREVYGLHIWVDYSRLDCNEKQPYLWNIVETKIDGDYWGGTYNKSPKNAVESALNYTLKNLI